MTTNFTGKKTTIFGLGKSGRAAAKKLASLGARVVVTEAQGKASFAAATITELALLEKLGVEIEFGGHTLKAIEGDDLIVVSPGVHLDLPVLKEAKKRGIPIISEIELAYQFLTKPIIAVTGTNGKTTTTTLIGEMLKAEGLRVAVAGNIGLPLAEVNDTDIDYIVAEISSYQLETIREFKPWTSVILNIQPDHLERHRTMREYIGQKARVFMNQTGDDYAVYNRDDEQVREMVKSARAKTIGFSKAETGIITLPPEEIKIPGRHNLENSLAAAQAAYLCGVKKATVAAVLKSFPGVEHRIEYVSAINGVEFYNDSKGTNPDSAVVAIETFSDRGIVLILGGRDKGVGLSALARRVKEKVKEVVLIGEAADRFEKALKDAGFSALRRSGSMSAAVREAFSLAGPKDIVLLSPACASFDMFSNYEERGKAFKEMVRKLQMII